MIYGMIALSIICVILLGYIFIIRRQIFHMNRILEKRLDRNTSQLVNLELIDSRLNELSTHINQCLEAEEKLRLKVVYEEKDLRDMIANISHDLRTPLTAIKGYLQLMEQDSSKEKKNEKMAVVKTHIAELEQLISRFYEYAYLLDAADSVNIERFSLSNMVMESLAVAVPELERVNLQVEWQDSDYWIQADPDLTLRIIQNLIRNCITHAYRVVHVEIEKTCIEQKDWVTLHMKNPLRPGTKIDVAHIFDRFYVADKSRQTSGLGLSIVNVLAKSMGARAGADKVDNTLDIWIQFPMSRN